MMINFYDRYVRIQKKSVYFWCGGYHVRFWSVENTDYLRLFFQRRSFLEQRDGVVGADIGQIGKLSGYLIPNEQRYRFTEFLYQKGHGNEGRNAILVRLFMPQ